MSDKKKHSDEKRKSLEIIDIKEEVKSLTAYELKFQESAKVIDYCKSQQWQVVILLVGLYFGLVSIYLQIEKTNIIKLKFIYLQWAIVIIATFTLLVGLKTISNLYLSIVKHRKRINTLNNYLILPKDLQEEEENQKKKQEWSSELLKQYFGIFLSFVLVKIYILLMIIVCPFKWN